MPAECGLETLATAAPGRMQRRVAAICCLLWLAITAALLPWSSVRIGPMPGFIPAYQTLLIGVYALTSYLFFVQYRRARSTPLLILGGGALYATVIVAAQLLSFPGLLGAAALIGTGSNTTTWLWVFWHAGAPVVAFGYAVVERREPTAAVVLGTRRGFWIGPWTVAGCATLVAVACAAAAAVGGNWLPRLVDGDNYIAMTMSGVGPAIVALTLLSLTALCVATRLRTVLQLWLAVSLVLLVADNCLTIAGDARGTVGWLAAAWRRCWLAWSC